MGKRVVWCERAFDGARRDAFVSAGHAPLIARLLAARGVDPACSDAFFNPALSRLVPPTSLPGIDRAVEVILGVVRSAGKIIVFGDYDVDGVCASAILVSTLRRFYPAAAADRVDVFIPSRFDEGYGMTAASLARLRREHPDVALVVTVDNGISSPDEVASLRRDGVAVVVTDHHLPGARLPEAEALVNPRVASAPGCEDLCGAGVAFFLAGALAEAACAQGLYAGPKFAGPLLVLAGLATVADLMPLLNQNRILVAQSLGSFARFAPLGLRELFARAARSATPMVARDYGFALAPRINAAGRMGSARIAYDLVMCEQEAEREQARELARQVDNFNVARKTVEQQMEGEARAQIAAAGEQAACVVRGEARDAAHPGGWHHGVAGVVAARLLEAYHVPVAVAVGDTGSVRAPDGYNVHDALAAAEAHLQRYGGHAAAGGFTVKPGAFEAFRAAFVRACGQQRAAAQNAAAHVFDAWVEPQDLTLELYEALRRLEPFGEGNPEPVFGLRGVAFVDVRQIGVEGRHAVFTFADRAVPRAVWWGHWAEVDALRAHGSNRFDVLFTLTTSDYGGRGEHLELRLVALSEAE